MANTPLQNFSAFLQNSYARAGLGLMGTGVMTTAVSVGVDSGLGTGAGVLALGGGAALMAHQRLSQMRQSGAPRPELPLTQADVPDETIKNNLSVELADRYAVLGEPRFRPLRDKMTENIFNAWRDQGRLVDSRYPDLRGCVTESLIEAEVAKIVASLAAASGPSGQLRDGLKSDLGDRTRRWAPLRVEEAAAAALKASYPIFEHKDYATMVSGMARKIYDEWFKQGSPAVLDKPGPATPLIEPFLHDRVRGLMTALAAKPGDIKLAVLLRELRKSERKRSMESSTLFTRLQKASRELETLSAYASQFRFPNETLKKQVMKTVEALRHAPEVISKSELDRYAGIEGKEGQEENVRVLAGLLADVNIKAEEARTKEEATVRERLKWLQRVVVGTGTVAGLEVETLAPLYPPVPEWAQNVTVRSRDAKGVVTETQLTLSPEGTVLDKARGLELQYRNGSWWLRDGRVLSRLNQLLKLWMFSINGRKLNAEGRWPLRAGDRVQDASGAELEFVLGEEPPLERLRESIARSKSLQDMADVLKSNGQRALSQQIEAYLNEGDAFTDVPQTGGLRAKLAELVLRRESSILHERYFLNLSYADAETEMAKIAQAVSESRNVKGLAEAVQASSLPAGMAIAQAILATEAAGQERSFDDIPTAFGIRERLILFLRENERVMRARMGQLGGEVSRLTQELRSANAGIKHRDGLITQAAAREASLNAELARARESLTAQERAAQVEKDRLEALHKAALARAAAARQELIKNHEEALRQKRDEMEAAEKEHKRLQDEKDAAHQADQDRKDDGMRRQTAEHLRLQGEKDAAHKAAQAQLKREHADDVASREAAYEQLRLAGEEAIKTRDELHERAVAELQAKYVAELQAAARKLEDELRNQRGFYEGRLAELNEKRAEAAAEITRLEGVLAALNDEKGRVEKVRNEKEAARAAAQKEVERLLGVERDLGGRLQEKTDALTETTEAKQALQKEFDANQETLGEKVAEIAELTDARDAAQRNVNRLEQELETANAEFKRLTETELPMWEQRVKGRERELKDMWSAFTDYEHAFGVYLDEVRQAARSSGELSRVEEYLNKLEQIQKTLDKKLAQAGQEKAPESEAIPVVEDAELLVEDDAAVPPAFPEEITTKVDLRQASPAAAVAAPAVEAPHMTTSQRQRLLGPYFGVMDPRTQRVDKFDVMGTRDLHSMEGERIGQAWIRAGDLRDDTPFSHVFADGSIVSAKTSIAVPKRPRNPGEKETQEDGLYMASYRLPDGREVKIMAGADGAGGMGGGDLASSSFLQGIHAAVHQAAAEGRNNLTAEELFQAGQEAVLFQKNQSDRPEAAKATGSAGIIVVIGNQATIATIGDAMVVHGRKQYDGSYRVTGYSDVQHLDTLGNEALRQQLNFAQHGKAIIKGIGLEGFQGQPRLYAQTMKPGDRFAFGSDGLHEPIAGKEYKNSGSMRLMREASQVGIVIPPMTRGHLAAYERFFAETAGTTDAGALLHDRALEIMKPVLSLHDNIFAASYEQGDVEEVFPAEAPKGHTSLESLWSPFIGGSDPRTEPIQIGVSLNQSLLDRSGRIVGSSFIAAGGAENKVGLRLIDGSFLSAQTSAGVPKAGKTTNEDGYYTAMYTMPDGTPVKIMAVSDGAGGMGSTGHVASSAFLQGVHAAVAEAAYSGRNDLTAGELFEAGVQSVEAQNGFGNWDKAEQARLGVGDGRACATGSVVVIVGNRAMIATLGDSTVFYAVPLTGGGFRVAKYSNADYREFPGSGPDTSLIGVRKKKDDDDDDGATAKLGIHLYTIDNVENGAVFLGASDGTVQALAGSNFPVNASQDMRLLGPKLGFDHIEPPHDGHFRSLNQLLGLVSGQEQAALYLHAFALESMKRAEGDTTPVKMLNTDVPVPPKNKSINDHLVIASLQHAAGNYPAVPAPEGYGAMPEVTEVTQQPIPNVSVAIATDRKPKNPGDKFPTVGRGDACDAIIPHGTVSGRHAYLAFNAKKEGPFEANTWYLQPLTDNATGTHVDGKPISKGDWAALKPGSRLRLGGVPLIVTVGGADMSLRLITDVDVVPASLRSPVPPPMPSAPRIPSPPPSPPAASGRPSRVSPVLAAAMERDARPDDDGIPRSRVSPPPPPGSVPSAAGEPAVDDQNVRFRSMTQVNFVSATVLRTGKLKKTEGVAGMVYDLPIERGAGRVPLASALRLENGAFRVQPNHEGSKVRVVRPGDPKEGIEIPHGRYIDVPADTIVIINGDIRILRAS